LIKVSKHTTVFPISLAILVILLHMFMPHDHHLDTSFTETDQSCNSHENEKGNRSAFPTHCHAFNVLDFEKSRASVNTTHEFAKSDFHTFEITNPNPSRLTGTNLRYSDFQDQPIITDFQKLSLLRAPPLLV
jgi:hypothetical protein